MHRWYSSTAGLSASHPTHRLRNTGFDPAAQGILALIGFIVGLRSVLRQELRSLLWRQPQLAPLGERAGTLFSGRARLTRGARKEHRDASGLLASLGHLPRLILLPLRTAHALLLPVHLKLREGLSLVCSYHNEHLFHSPAESCGGSFHVTVDCIDQIYLEYKRGISPPPDSHFM
jgi:hypothetical protein